MHSSAHRALADYLNTQIDQIVAGDEGLRRDEEPIHDTRVAIRRLRSTLRVFGKVQCRQDARGLTGRGSGRRR